MASNPVQSQRVSEWIIFFLVLVLVWICGSFWRLGLSNFFFHTLGWSKTSTLGTIGLALGFTILLIAVIYWLGEEALPNPSLGEAGFEILL